MKKTTTRFALMSFAALVALTATSGARAADQRRLVVLAFTGPSIARETLASATTAAEAAALKEIGTRLDVVTREMLAAIVGEDKLLKCEAASRCELDLGVGLGTGYLLSGSVHKALGRFELAVKLYDVSKMRLLSQETASGATERDVVDRVGEIVTLAIRTGLRLGAPAQPRTIAGAFQESPAATLSAGPDEVVVAFESEPVGAAVLVDDQLLCKETPCRKRLAAGPHAASFQKERYAASMLRFTAATGAVVKAALAPRFGWLSVETAPAGIGIAIDGRDAGRSPVAWREVDEGVREVAISDPCFLKGGERVPMRAGERRSVKLAPKARIAGLKVDAEDDKGDAIETDVVVDGKVVGRAGATLQVPVCARNVTVSLGAETFQRDLELEEGKVAVVVARSTGMVSLRGGTYVARSTKRSVSVAPFLVDRMEVTVASYAECVHAGRCSKDVGTVEHAGVRPIVEGGANPDAAAFSRMCNWGKADRLMHPMNCLDWNQAMAYCTWLGKRLPTEEEWEWAASGAGRGSQYPWGDDRPSDQLCWSGEGSDRGAAKHRGTCEVGSHPRAATPQGVHDLAGNVSEWTSSSWDAQQRVVLGGDWGLRRPDQMGADFRVGRAPEGRYNSVGFRCARTR